MNSVEFGQQYIDDFEGAVLPVEKFTTALVLRTLGVREEQYDPVITSYTKNAANNVLESAIRTNGNELRYLKGEYVPPAEGGMGNPSYFLLSFAMRSLWVATHASVVDNDTVNPVDKRGMDLAFADLRGIGADQLWRRDRLIRASYGGSVREYARDQDEVTSAARKHTEGLLNEFDAALVLGAIALKNNLSLFPSPPMFERSRQANSDFLLIDPRTQEVAGVQVKLKAKDDHDLVVSSEQSGIVLLSGMHDLENYRSHYSKDTGKNVTYPYAGLVVEMCNKFYDWRSPQADAAVNKNDGFHPYVIRQRSRKHTIAQKYQLYDNYSRIVDHVWAKVQPVLRG